MPHPIQWVPGLSRGGWASETAWTGAENLDLPGFDLRTFQSLASRYTDYAISAPTVVRSQSKIEANKLEDFSARIVFRYTELDVVHILVLPFWSMDDTKNIRSYFDLQLILWLIKLIVSVRHFLYTNSTDLGMELVQ